MSFAENLKYILEFKDIQVKELSYQTGISKNTIDNYLSGQKSLPNAENAVKIAQYLGVSVEYLVTGKRILKQEGAQMEVVSGIAAKLMKFNSQDLCAVEAIIDSIKEKYDKK